MTIANGGSYGGGLGGGRVNGGGSRPVPQRSVGAPESNAMPDGGLGGGAAGAAAGGRPGAGGGIPPGLGGMGGMGGGQQREHRNTTYIPSDDPFRMKFDDVAPAVIGADWQQQLFGDDEDEY
jgi:hypothetical protein